MRTLLVASCLVVMVAPVSNAQHEASRIEALNSRLDAQAAEIQELRALLEQQPSLYGVFPNPDASGCAGGHVRRLALVAEQPVAEDCGETGAAARFLKLDYYADYDRGLVIRAFDPSEHPFSLKVNG